MIIKKVEEKDMFSERIMILNSDEKLLSSKSRFRFNEVPRYLIQKNDYIYCNQCDIFGTNEQKKKYAQTCPFHKQNNTFPPSKDGGFHGSD